jgi:hypothetical protein
VQISVGQGCGYLGWLENILHSHTLVPVAIMIEKFSRAYPESMASSKRKWLETFVYCCWQVENTTVKTWTEVIPRRFWS